LLTSPDFQQSRRKWRAHESGTECRIIHHALALHHVIEQTTAADGRKASERTNPTAR